MQHTIIAGALFAATALVGTACEDGGVQSETEDLRKAQENAGQRLQVLEQELAEAKQRVVQLEEERALAERGITEEVVQEREELRRALEEREQELAEEVRETRETAQEYGQEAQEATQELQEVEQVERVEGTIETDTQIETREPQVEQRRVDTTIPVERTETEELEPLPTDVEEGEAEAKPGE